MQGICHKQKIIFMAAGPIRHKVKNTTEDKFEQQVIVHQLYDPPPRQLMNSEERPKISDAYRWIMENDERTQRIINDVLACLEQSKHPIVLTERREHAETINAKLLDRGIYSVVLKGAMRAAERKAVEGQLPTAQVVVATGKYVGEGFDLPRLDTLFLAMPIAWKGLLAQYAGRIHRESDGKERVTIYDYVDCSLPMLQRMFNKREKSYKAMGYQISFNNEAPEQSQLSTEFLLASDKQGSEAPA
jgi:superfamily II DNA or RNA helicase